jgi:proteasome regulatory subunit
MNLAKGVDLKELARITPNATGADIKAICTEAGMFAIREGRDTVEFSDFERAISKVIPAQRTFEIPGYPSKPEKMYGY